MVHYDSAQQQVLDLDRTAHARIVGAAGTGKTECIIEFVVRQLQHTPQHSMRTVVLTPQRVAAQALTEAIESRSCQTLSGTLAFTPTALAFHLENEQRALKGEPPARLLTGAQQDEFVLDALRELAQQYPERLPAHTLENVSFRTQLRDLWTVLDEHDTTVDELMQASSHLRATATTSSLHMSVSEQWELAADVLGTAHQLLARRAPDQFSASGILRSVVHRLSEGRVQRTHELPQLILVDQAQDLTVGVLGMLAGLANTGTRVWFFGNPDTATAQHQGELTRVLSDHIGELQRAGAITQVLQGREQIVQLSTQYRFGKSLQDLVTTVTERIGVGQGWQHRTPVTAGKNTSEVAFVTAVTHSQQLGMIAHQLRSRFLGLDGGARISWSEMAVICRSQDEVQRLIQGCTQLGIPTKTESSGIVLKQSALVRELLRLLQHALNIRTLTPAEEQQLLTGPVIGLDALGVRKFAHTLVIGDRMLAHETGRRVHSFEQLLSQVYAGHTAVPDMREGRAVNKVVVMLEHAVSVAQAGGSAREVLWALWDKSGLAPTLQSQALALEEPHSRHAHEFLDAVLALFFAFERREEQGSTRTTAEFIDELLRTDVPEDTLARRSFRDAVTVTTPSGVVAREFAVVCIAGPQEGMWPNLRPRGALTGARVLAQYLRTHTLETVLRTQTLHDELRLFACALTRARDAVFVIARADDEDYPSTFFHLGHKHQVDTLPDTSLTLASHTAQLRRRLITVPTDARAADALSLLAKHEVRGASPDTWYGMRSPSTEAPVATVNAATGPITVSPSQIETVEQCPLNWFLSSVATPQPQARAQLGTLLHYALEAAPDGGEALHRVIDEHWGDIHTTAQWENTMLYQQAQDMVIGLRQYLRDNAHAGTTLIAGEAKFHIDLGDVQLRGVADRIELVRTDTHPEGIARVVDLKTGRSPVSAKDVAEHPQLLAYQLGLTQAEFGDATTTPSAKTRALTFDEIAGAALLYVHPDAVTKSSPYRLVEQAPIDEGTLQAITERVRRVAHTMSGHVFVAEVDHHCHDRNQTTPCRAQLIPAVSHA